jgi:hypothetical protein
MNKIKFTLIYKNINLYRANTVITELILIKMHSPEQAVVKIEMPSLHCYIYTCLNECS